MRANRCPFAVLLLVCAVFTLALPAAAQEAAPPEKGRQLPGWLGGDQPEFFRMPPFNVPTIREAGVVGQVALLVVIETRGVANKNKVIEKRVPLQSAFLRDLYGVASINTGSGQPVNLDTVKKRLSVVAERILGPGVVKDILVESVYTRQFETGENRM